MIVHSNSARVRMPRAMHEDYFRRRLMQELKRAEECHDPGERAVHLEACRHYRALLDCGSKKSGSAGH